MLPLVLGWMVIFRPPLELKADGDEIQYRFTDEAFKSEFESLNPRPESPIDVLKRNLGADLPTWGKNVAEPQ
jgi:hypothetical protein